MKWLKRICVLVILGAFFFWGLLFSSENTTQVALNLVFWEFPAARLSLWILSTFAVGALLGLLLSIALIARLQAKMRSAQRKAAHYEKELDTLRHGTLKAP